MDKEFGIPHGLTNSKTPMNILLKIPVLESLFSKTSKVKDV